VVGAGRNRDIIHATPDGAGIVQVESVATGRGLTKSLGKPGEYHQISADDATLRFSNRERIRYVILPSTNQLVDIEK
jgi:hypothetical protein